MIIYNIINNLLKTDEIQGIFSCSNYDELLSIFKQNLRIYSENKLDKHLFEISKSLDYIINKFSTLSNKDYYEDCTYASLKDQLTKLKSFIESSNFSVGQNKYAIYCLHLLLLLYLCVGYTNINIKDDNLNLFNNTLKNSLSVSIKGSFWYRGISNIDYDLIPTMYRNLECGNHFVIDNEFIKKLYEQNNLRNEYKTVMHSPSDTNEFYKYMQHSISYSPLTDFTESINIAGSFAVSYANFNDCFNCDAGIYFLIRNINLSHKTYKFNVDVFTRKLQITDTIHGKPLLFCTLDDFDVKYTVLDKPTNDRMKYQQGALLKIHRAVFVNNKLLFPYSTSFILKGRISCKRSLPKLASKDGVADYLHSKYPYYSLEYLMNPYLWFSKRHK